jgi:hypothetical protein
VVREAGERPAPPVDDDSSGGSNHNSDGGNNSSNNNQPQLARSLARTLTRGRHHAINPIGAGG